MRKRFLHSFITIILIAVISFITFSTKAPSLKDLSATAGAVCREQAGSDCLSPQTGIIYFGWVYDSNEVENQ